MKRKKDKILVWIILLTLLCGIAHIPINEVYAASKYRLNKVQDVEKNHVFNDSTTAPTLNIEEEGINTFGTKQQIFQLKLENAEWLKDHDFSDSSFEQEMKSLCEDLIITRLEDTIVQVQMYNNTPDRTDELISKIPMLVKVQNEGEVKVTIDSKNSDLTDAVFLIANVLSVDTATTVEYNTSDTITYIISYPDIATDIIEVKYPVDQSIMYINGTEIKTNSTNRLIDNHIYVPIRYIAKGLEVSSSNIYWDEEARTTTIANKDYTAKFVMGSSEIEVIGPVIDIIDMGVVPVIIDDKMHIPAKYVFEAFGFKVFEDNKALKARNEGNIIESSYPIGESYIYINGSKIKTIAPNKLINNTLYTPMSSIIHGLGIESTFVGWYGEPRTFNMSRKGKNVKLVVGSSEIEVDLKVKDMGISPMAINGMIYIPAKYVFEAFGFKVFENNKILKATNDSI